MNGRLTTTGTLVFDGGPPLRSWDRPRFRTSRSRRARSGRHGREPHDQRQPRPTSGPLRRPTALSRSRSRKRAVPGRDARRERGIVDVAGNVTFLGTTSSASPAIRCAGNWTADANLRTPSGTVELDGACADDDRCRGRRGNPHVPHARHQQRHAVAAQRLHDRGSPIMTIAPTGSLAISGADTCGSTRTGATAFNVNGRVGVATNSELSMGPQTSATDRRLGHAQSRRDRGAAREDHRRSRRRLRPHRQRDLAAKHFVVKEMGHGGMVVEPLGDDRRGAERPPERHVRLPVGRACRLGPARPPAQRPGGRLRRARVPQHAGRRRSLQREDRRGRTFRSASRTGPARSRARRSRTTRTTWSPGTSRQRPASSTSRCGRAPSSWRSSGRPRARRTSPATSVRRALSAAGPFTLVTTQGLGTRRDTGSSTRRSPRTSPSSRRSTR